MTAPDAPRRIKDESQRSNDSSRPPPAENEEATKRTASKRLGGQKIQPSQTPSSTPSSSSAAAAAQTISTNPAGTTAASKTVTPAPLPTSFVKATASSKVPGKSNDPKSGSPSPPVNTVDNPSADSNSNPAGSLAESAPTADPDSDGGHNNPEPDSTRVQDRMESRSIKEPVSIGSINTVGQFDDANDEEEFQPSGSAPEAAHPSIRSELQEEPREESVGFSAVERNRETVCKCAVRKSDSIDHDAGGGANTVQPPSQDTVAATSSLVAESPIQDGDRKATDTSSSASNHTGQLGKTPKKRNDSLTRIATMSDDGKPRNASPSCNGDRANRAVTDLPTRDLADPASRPDIWMATKFPGVNRTAYSTVTTAARLRNSTETHEKGLARLREGRIELNEGTDSGIDRMRKMVRSGFTECIPTTLNGLNDKSKSKPLLSSENNERWTTTTYTAAAATLASSGQKRPAVILEYADASPKKVRYADSVNKKTFSCRATGNMPKHLALSASATATEQPSAMRRTAQHAVATTTIDEMDLPQLNSVSARQAALNASVATGVPARQRRQATQPLGSEDPQVDCLHQTNMDNSRQTDHHQANELRPSAVDLYRRMQLDRARKAASLPAQKPGETTTECDAKVPSYATQSITGRPLDDPCRHQGLTNERPRNVQRRLAIESLSEKEQQDILNKVLASQIRRARGRATVWHRQEQGFLPRTFVAAPEFYQREDENGLVYEPGPNDAIFGRLKGIRNHAGSKQFRSWIGLHRKSYCRLQDDVKPRFIYELAKAWTISQYPPGRFLQERGLGKTRVECNASTKTSSDAQHNPSDVIAFVVVGIHDAVQHILDQLSIPDEHKRVISGDREGPTRPGTESKHLSQQHTRAQSANHNSSGWELESDYVPSTNSAVSDQFADAEVADEFSAILAKSDTAEKQLGISTSVEMEDMVIDPENKTTVLYRSSDFLIYAPPGYGLLIEKLEQNTDLWPHPYRDALRNQNAVSSNQSPPGSQHNLLRATKSNQDDCHSSCDRRGCLQPKYYPDQSKISRILHNLIEVTNDLGSAVVGPQEHRLLGFLLVRKRGDLLDKLRRTSPASPDVRTLAAQIRSLDKFFDLVVQNRIFCTEENLGRCHTNVREVEVVKSTKPRRNGDNERDDDSSDTVSAHSSAAQSPARPTEILSSSAEEQAEVPTASNDTQQQIRAQTLVAQVGTDVNARAAAVNTQAAAEPPKRYLPGAAITNGTVYVLPAMQPVSAAASNLAARGITQNRSTLSAMYANAGIGPAVMLSNVSSYPSQLSFTDAHYSYYRHNSDGEFPGLARIQHRQLHHQQNSVHQYALQQPWRVNRFHSTTQGPDLSSMMVPRIGAAAPSSTLHAAAHLTCNTSPRASTDNKAFATGTQYYRNN